jgi:hypothetical protein
MRLAESKLTASNLAHDPGFTTLQLPYLKSLVITTIDPVVLHIVPAHVPRYLLHSDHMPATVIEQPRIALLQVDGTLFAKC